MKRLPMMLVLAALLPGAQGCLIKDQTSTWYLDPSGIVTWSVLERDVRSDANELGDRQIEESTYLTDVRATRHPVALGLIELRPLEVRARLLRATVPFSVQTDARFASIGGLGEQIISRAGLFGTSTLATEGDELVWTFSVRDPHTVDHADEPDDALQSLGDNLEHLKVMLTEGRFTAAEGFELSADRRSASLISPDEDEFARKAQVTLKLKWTGR